MTMSFEACLEAICKEIFPSPDVLRSHNEDAEKIRDHLIEEMKSCDSNFENSFYSFSMIENCENHWNTDLPDEYDHHMKLKMPFPIMPVEYANQPGFILLTTPTEISHPIVHQNCISRLRLQDWIRNTLRTIICEGFSLTINGRIYNIEYPMYGRGYGVTHTILAKEVHSGTREISFDLIPAFEFHSSDWPLSNQLPTSEEASWLAIPFGKKLQNGNNKIRPDEYTFMECQFHWEHKNFHSNEHLRNSLRLMKVIRDAKGLFLLTNYMLKNIYVEQIKVQPQEFWEQPVGCLLIEMLEVLLQALRHHYLPFFNDKRFKNLSELRKELFKLYPIQLNLILQNLRHFQKQSKVNYADVAAFSYARNNCGRHRTHFSN